LVLFEVVVLDGSEDLVSFLDLSRRLLSFRRKDHVVRGAGEFALA
jgi:hypothetical protein